MQIRVHKRTLCKAMGQLLQLTVVAMLFVSVLTISCDTVRHGASQAVNACVEHSVDVGFAGAADAFQHVTTFVALPLIMLFVLAGISVRMIPRRLATAIIERQRRLRGLWARRMPFVSSKRFLLNFAPVRDF